MAYFSPCDHRPHRACNGCRLIAEWAMFTLSSCKGGLAGWAGQRKRAIPVLKPPRRPQSSCLASALIGKHELTQWMVTDYLSAFTTARIKHIRRQRHGQTPP